MSNVVEFVRQSSSFQAACGVISTDIPYDTRDDLGPIQLTLNCLIHYRRIGKRVEIVQLHCRQDGTLQPFQVKWTASMKTHRDVVPVLFKASQIVVAHITKLPHDRIFKEKFPLHPDSFDTKGT